MKVIAIIPARGGSKGIPGKNIKVIADKSLISYTIEAAIESKKIDSIVVSSEDKLILEIASEYKNILLHKRSPNISGDESPVTETVRSVLNEFDDNYFDAVMLLQPTSPLRTANDIDNAIEALEEKSDYSSVISVVSMDDVNPARMYKLENETLKPFVEEYEQARRQDIPIAYYRNGAIYLVRKNVFLNKDSMMVKPIFPYIMDSEWLLNIDSPRDLLIAEVLIPAWKKINIKS